MTNPQSILYLAAAVILILGAAMDLPRFNVTRCIVLALAFVLVAQILK